MRSQRTVGPNNSKRAIVHNDVVTNGVDVFHPLTLGSLQLREPAEILDRESCVACQGMKQNAFVIFKSRTISEEAYRPEVLVVAGGNRHEDDCGAGMFGQAGECGVGREELNL